MNERLLNNISIRVTTRYNGYTLHGSGVIVQNAKKVNYVITAEHCIFGKEDDRAKFKDINHSDISIECRDYQNGSINRIQTKNIAYTSVEEDITIIELAKGIESEENINYSIFSEIHNEEHLHFRGFPKWLQSNNEANTYKCVYKEQRDKSSFFIKSEDIVDSSGLKTADFTASGLSGSGVFLYKENKLHLIGIVTNIRDDNGTFGHLVCKKLNNVFEHLKMEHSNPFNPKSLLEWSKTIDRNEIEAKIKELENQENQEFENLLRKCIVLYEDEALNMTYDYLLKYFDIEVQLFNIRGRNSILYDDIKIATEILRDRVKSTYNKLNVNNKTEAQKILENITGFFEERLRNQHERPIKSNDLYLSGKGAVTKLLLDCDLDFIRK
jgi:V8-like Glu-specific endopeptidase